MRVFPHRMSEVLDAAKKKIRKNASSGSGDPNRSLLPSEEPFKAVAWGLLIEAESLEDGLLTWKILEDAVEGLFLCVLDKGHTNMFRAMIRGVVDGETGTFGWIRLKSAYPSDNIREVHSGTG